MSSSYRQVFSAIILRFLNRGHTAQQVGKPKPVDGRAYEGRQPESVPVSEGLEGGQPVVRLLDNSDDIAEVYSRTVSLTGIGKIDSGLLQQTNTHGSSLPLSTGLSSSQEREISGLDNRRKGDGNGISHPAPESNLLTFTCDTAHATFCGEFVCEEPAVGICKHCKQFVCKRCVKSGECYAADRHEVSLQ